MKLTKAQKARAEAQRRYREKIKERKGVSKGAQEGVKSSKTPLKLCPSACGDCPQCHAKWDEVIAKIDKKYGEVWIKSDGSASAPLEETFFI